MQYLAEKFSNSNLLIKIKNKGLHEQETDYLFPALYKNGKTVTRQEKGAWKQFNNKLKSGKFEPIN